MERDGRDAVLFVFGALHRDFVILLSNVSRLTGLTSEHFVIPTDGFSPSGGTCCSVSRVTFFFGERPDHDSVEHCYYVYILASKSRVLYVGVTNNLAARLREHRNGTYAGFAEHYKAHRLVYYETFAWVQDAIAREKQLKRWRREKKVFLIERCNPTWEDLSAEWGKPAVLRITQPAR